MAWIVVFGGCATDVGVHHPGSGGSGGTSGDMANGVGGNGGTGGSGGTGGTGGSGGGLGDAGVTYTIYAHSNTVLYTVDLATKMLVTVGPFNAPIAATTKKADVIQDLAVAPDNTIYVISPKSLYTADPNDGHVTVVGTAGSLGDCGTDNVALTTTPDGKLYSADFNGSFCEIDITVNPPTVTVIGKLDQNLAISGDIVGLGDGSIYGTAYNLADKSGMGTQASNVLIKLDPKTGLVTQQIGATGYPNLYGVAFANGQVYGFTHDKTGHVITIDPKTGVGTPFGTFSDSSGPISFGGAGVNSMVPPPPIS